MPRSRRPDRDTSAVHSQSGGLPPDGPPSNAPDGESRTGPTADIHIRNYDVQETYDVVVRADATHSDRTFQRRYTLRPGQSRSVIGVLDAGVYEVTVALDPVREQTAPCDIGTVPERTALVEVGNGAVDVSQGLY